MAEVTESGEEEQHDGDGMVPLQAHHELFQRRLLGQVSGGHFWQVNLSRGGKTQRWVSLDSAGFLGRPK